MFCQQLKILPRCGRSLLGLNATQSQAFIYNDAMPEKAAMKPRKRLTPVYQAPELDETSFAAIFTVPGKPKKDWLEDFRRVEWTPWGLRNWWKRRRQDKEMELEIMIDWQHEVLGSDLAAARYVVTRGGRAKFLGRDSWTYMGCKRNRLPSNYHPSIVLDQLDCANMQLPYEAIMHFINLTRLRKISFRGNKVLDDFCMDKIASEFPNLEYLDVSECPKVTQRGIEALYKLPYLRRLITTNYEQCEAFELTCLMLEECIPSLSCDMEIPMTLEDIKREMITSGEQK